MTVIRLTASCRADSGDPYLNSQHLKHSKLPTHLIMHEMGIALQIIEIAKASIPADLKDVRVERVNLKVGRLAAVIPSSLRFCFEVAAKETPLEGAHLRIEEIPVAARCNDCGHDWIIERAAFSCPECHSGSIQTLSGRELDIESIEIAEEDPSDDAARI